MMMELQVAREPVAEFVRSAGLRINVGWVTTAVVLILTGVDRCWLTEKDGYCNTIDDFRIGCPEGILEWPLSLAGLSG
jgi:hypothetical protein